MTYEKQSLPNSKVELIIRITKEELAPHAERSLDAFRKKLELPGFRKGEIPREIAKSRISEMQLLENAGLCAAREAFAEIIGRENLEIVDTPELTATKLAPGNDAEFKATFPTLPQFSLSPNWKDIVRDSKTERREVSVKEEEVDSALQWLRQSRSKISDETGKPAKKGDLVQATIEAEIGGAPVKDGTMEHYSFVLGSANLIPGVEEGIVGLKSGERKEFGVKSPDDYWNEALRGREIIFRVAVESVKEREVPELNDEFARSAGKFKDLNDLCSGIKQGILEEKRREEKERFRILMLERLSKNTDFELPEPVVDHELDKMLEELRSETSGMGLPWEKYLTKIGRDEETLRKELRPLAETRARYALILRTVSREESLNPSKEEVKAEIDRYLLQLRSPDETKHSIDAAELERYTRSILKNEKAFQELERIAGI